jgi:hypothetical protein
VKCIRKLNVYRPQTDDYEIRPCYHETVGGHDFCHACLKYMIWQKQRCYCAVQGCKLIEDPVLDCHIIYYTPNPKGLIYVVCHRCYLRYKKSGKGSEKRGQNVHIENRLARGELSCTSDQLLELVREIDERMAEILTNKGMYSPTYLKNVRSKMLMKELKKRGYLNENNL